MTAVATKPAIRPEVGDHIGKMGKILENTGAILSDAGIHDPIEAAREAAQREDTDAHHEASGRFDQLLERIEALEAQVRERDQEIERVARQVSGDDREIMEWQTRRHQRDEHMKRELERIRTEQNGVAVIIVSPDTNPAMNAIPIKGSVNFRKFLIRRGIPTLVNVAILETIHGMRTVAIEPFVDTGGSKRKRIVDVWRAPFTICPPSQNAEAKAF